MEKVMNREDQKRAPIYEALEKFRKQRVVPFDVPGHKRGRGNPELVELLGEKCVGIDVNSMKPLDNLCHPVSVIRDAEELAADAFHAEHAFLMVGGTTSAVQSMILSVCKRGDKIILPRNVHKSAINASSSASLITETGWQRLSSGFIELTSSPTHFSPRSCASSGFPLPLLCPGTSKGTTLFFRKRSSASYMGACCCLS